MNDEELQYDQFELEKFLSAHYQSIVKVLKIEALGGRREKDALKKFGYGQPIYIRVEISPGIEDEIVLHTVRSNKFGFERRSDRAQSILLDYDTFNSLPRHVTSMDVGSFMRDGTWISLKDSGEFFAITQYISGRLYAEDLKRLTGDRQLLPEDQQRAMKLADYLAEIHATKNDSPSEYLRTARDLLGHGEGIMGIIDSYPPDFPEQMVSRLQAIEKRLVDWRWKIKSRFERLSQVHGDFHPWNVLFQEDGGFFLLDRSRGEWGEPADDLSAMTINYLFFSLRGDRRLSGPFKVLFDKFWEQYIQRTKDVEISGVIQPFYAWRGLVLANPVWYPEVDWEVRKALFGFVEKVLEEDWFDPDRVNAYLGEG